MSAILFSNLQRTSWDSILRSIDEGLTHHEGTFSSSVFDMAYSGWRVSKIAESIASLDLVPQFGVKVATYALGLFGISCLWSQRSPPPQNEIRANAAVKRNNLINRHPDEAMENYLMAQNLSQVFSVVLKLTDLSLTLFELKKNQTQAVLKLATIGILYFVDYCSEKIGSPERDFFIQIMNLKRVYLSPAIKAYMIYQDYRSGLYTTRNYRLLADGCAHVYSLLRILPQR